MRDKLLALANEILKLANTAPPYEAEMRNWANNLRALASQPIAEPAGDVEIESLIADAGGRWVDSTYIIDACDMFAFVRRLAQPRRQCQTCNGYGVIGTQSGSTPETFEQGEELCPDCSEPEQPQRQEECGFCGKAGKHEPGERCPDLDMQPQRQGPALVDSTVARHVADKAHGTRYGVDWAYHDDTRGLLSEREAFPEPQWPEIERCKDHPSQPEPPLCNHCAGEQPASKSQGQAEPFGHIYRVANERTLSRTWEDTGACFRTGPAPHDGLKGRIQYLNLYTEQPASAAVADGWKLVPIFPTEEMIEAAYDADSPGDDPSATPQYSVAWAAMLAAAPDRSQSGGG